MAKPNPAGQVLYRGYKRWELDRYKRLVPFKRALNEKYGAGGWGDDEMVDYLDARKSEAKYKQEAVAKDEQALATSRAGKIAARKRKYLSAFSHVTPNDEIMFGELAELEQQLDDLSGRAFTEIEDTKKAGELRLKIIKEHRALQEDLGIARNQRDDELGEAGTLQQLISRSQAVLAEQSIPIECGACRRRGVKINLGFLLYHFRQNVPFRLITDCPKCGKPIIIQGRLPFTQPPEHYTTLAERRLLAGQVIEGEATDDDQDDGAPDSAAGPGEGRLRGLRLDDELGQLPGAAATPVERAAAANPVRLE